MSPGGNGGGLGYSDWGGPGITDGFLGVGLDTYGNYANGDGTQTNLNGTSSNLGTPLPNYIGIRGEGNGTTGYSWLTGSPYAPGIDGTRTVRIDLLPDGSGQEKLSLYMSADGGQTFQEIISNEEVNQALPSQFYFGFAASTGGGNDIHAIDNVDVTLPIDLSVSAPVLTAPSHANEAAGTLLPGDTFSYTYSITDTGPNGSSEISLNDALPVNATDVQWSVQDDNHGAANPLTGTGAIALSDISLASGHMATVTVTGKISSDATSGNLDHVVTVSPGAAYSFLTPSNGQTAFDLGGNALTGFVGVPATVTADDTGELQPFAKSKLFDNTGATDTLTVMVNPALGSLSSQVVPGAIYDAATGTLTFTGSAAAARLALDGLVFTPSGISKPGQSVSVPLALTISDGANHSSTSTVLTYTAPVLTAGLADDTGPSSSDGISSSDALSGTTAPGATVTVLNGATVLGSVTAGSDGHWSIAPTLADGGYDLTVVAAEANRARRAPAGALPLDTATPSISLSAAETVANSPTPVISGTTAGGATVSLLLDGHAIGSTTADASGHWSYEVASPLSTGSYQVTAQATDLAGNVSAVSAPSTLIDIAAPGASGVSVADGTGLTLAQIVGSGSSMQFLPATQAVQLADGVLSIGPDTQQAYLARLYQGLFGRPADTSGISYWNAQLDAGESTTNVAQAFLDSREGQAATAGLSDQQFVQALYKGLLGRTGSGAEVAYWENDLTNGASRAQVLSSIAESRESQQALSSATSRVWVPDPNATLVEKTYETAFDRMPELHGLTYWTAALKSGLSVSDFEQAVVGSPEFRADYGNRTDNFLVTSLYQNGLGRAPSSAELASAVGALHSGAQTPGSVLAMVAISPEANVYLGAKLT